MVAVKHPSTQRTCSMPNDRQKLFLEGPIGTALLRLAIPIILGNVLQTGYQLTDAFWVGRLGAAAVAAVSVSFPVTFLVIALGAGLAIAGATLSAQYMGAGRQDMVNHVAAQTMLMVAITSVVWARPAMCWRLTCSNCWASRPDVYHGALGFMRVSFIGIIFVFLYAMFQALMRGVGETRMPLIIVLGTVMLNFVLDPLFIFGLGRLPPQGVMGAALATLATQALAAALGMVIFLRGRHGIQLVMARLSARPAYIKRAFFLGLAGLDRALDPRARAVADVVSGGGLRHGDAGGLRRRIEHPAVRHHPGDGIVDGRLDAGQPEHRCRQHPARGAGDGAGRRCRLCHPDAGGNRRLSFAPAIVAFFVPGDADVIAEGARFIRIMCLAWGGIGVQLCIVSAFRASGNMLIAMVIALVSQFMFQFPLAYVLSKHTSLPGRRTMVVVPDRQHRRCMVSACWFAQGGWKKTRLTEEDKEAAQVTKETIAEEGIR